MKSLSLKYRIINFLANKSLIASFTFVVKRKIDSRAYLIPIISGRGKEHLVDNEPWMTILLKRYKSEFENKLFLDIGVNVGQTLLKVKAISSKVNIIGFEPNPYCVTYLLDLIRINKIESVTIIPTAIANERNQFKLLMDNTSLTDTTASIINTFRKGKVNKIDIVSVLPEDVRVLTEDKIGVIKIDVEGAELEVLEGLKSIISKNRPVIIIEILPVYTVGNEDRYKRQMEILNFIKELKYSIHRIDEESGELLELETIEVHSNISWCNYVLVP